MRAWCGGIAGIIILAGAFAGISSGVFMASPQAQEQPQGHVNGATPVPAEPQAAEEAERPLVEIPPDRQRLIGVKTSPAQVSAMAKTIRLTGRIEYDEQKLFTVNAKVEGWIEQLYADYTGRYVKKGEPVAELYSPELLAAQQELIDLSTWDEPDGGSDTARMLTGDAQRLKEAARQRLRLWDVSKAQIELIVKTGTPIRTITITSPVSGSVIKRYAARGMKVMAGEPLVDLADLSRVWVVAEVNESDAGLVRLGQQAGIAVSGLPGRSLSSKIDFVYPVLNEQTRTLMVRGSLPNPDGVLRPGMFAVVEIPVDLGSRLSVPDEAVMDTGQRQIVFVDAGEGLFELRSVVAGIRAGGRREIVSGLKAGEKVASSALFLIDSEAQLMGVTPASP